MSKKLKVLEKQLATLRSYFLPDPFDPLGNYPNASRVQAHTRAYLVLAHAELETFLEEWAKDLARACEIAWDSSRKVNAPMAFLLTSGTDRLVIPEKLGAADISMQ